MPRTSPPAVIEVIARGVLVRAGRVLLCRNAKFGYAYLPGGHVEPDETAAAALAREFEEESGEAVRVGRLALIAEARFEQRGKRRHELSLVFHVEHRSRPDSPTPPPIRSREPKIAFDWVRIDELDDVPLLPRPLRDWLARSLAAPAAAPDGDAGAAWLSIEG